MRFLSSAIMVCFCLGLSGIVRGQDLSYLPDGLHKLNKEELKERPLTLRGIPFYLKGKQVSEQQLGLLVVDPAYALDYYGDANGKIKAVVIRSSDEQEERAKKELIPAPRNPIDWKGREAPVFERKDLAGNIMNLGDLKGKVVVLSFWFLKCKSCINEMPELNRLKKAFENKEVVFLAPTMNIGPDVNEFLKGQSFDFNVLPDARSLARRYGVMVYPMYFVIDQDGVVQFCQYQANARTRQILKEQIDSLLDK